VRRQGTEDLTGLKGSFNISAGPIFDAACDTFSACVPVSRDANREKEKDAQLTAATVRPANSNEPETAFKIESEEETITTDLADSKEENEDEALANYWPPEPSEDECEESESDTNQDLELSPNWSGTIQSSGEGPQYGTSVTEKPGLDQVHQGRGRTLECEAKELETVLESGTPQGFLIYVRGRIIRYQSVDTLQWTRIGN
jgi:hypothetical protein